MWNLPPFEELVDYFQLLGVTNKATKSIHGKVLHQNNFHILGDKFSSMQVMDPVVVNVFSFVRNCQIIFQFA